MNLIGRGIQCGIGWTISGWINQAAIESALFSGENGEGVVACGTDGVTGHVWNAIVQNGRVNYIDGQIGAGGA
ncbi:toxin glutamine deamidase domain-containing protein [Ralstonia solanacearum]|uniref:toxin glutamine deamidase domain-containing protein n=1 Tax=Ralstonia solanacearum TaxID=305 RepID=UPI003313004B